MTSILRPILAGALCGIALTGCRTLPDSQPTLAYTPCRPRIVAGILNSDEPLTRDERAYVERCGIRFIAPRFAR